MGAVGIIQPLAMARSIAVKAMRMGAILLLYD
jgi:hypothetical protein